MREMLLHILLAATVFSTEVKSSLSDNNILKYGEGASVFKLIEGCNRFSFELLRTVSSNHSTDQESKDIFFSPYSVWSALVVTYMGARGLTRDEMREILGVGDAPKAETWRTYKNIRHCNSPKHGRNVDGRYDTANRIYFQKGTILKKYIKKMLEENVAFVDFQNHSDEARNTINTWVEKYTHQMIKNFIPPESIDKRTKMVIANAVYFKEAWLQPFEIKKTVRRGFTTSLGQKVVVPMMSTSGMFLQGESKDLLCSVLDLPYSENNLGMMILLPKDRHNGINDLINNITPDSFVNLQENMVPREVTVSIPKLKFEDTYELSAALDGMGFKTLFDKSRINLSGFTGRREFELDSIYHRTRIEMNEMGAEVAAATDMFYFKSAGPSGRVNFVADHPFVYLILDYFSNTILFLGVVNDPTDKENY